MSLADLFQPVRVPPRRGQIVMLSVAGLEGDALEDYLSDVERARKREELVRGGASARTIYWFDYHERNRNLILRKKKDYYQKKRAERLAYAKARYPQIREKLLADRRAARRAAK